MTGAGKNFFLALNFFFLALAAVARAWLISTTTLSDRHMDADNEEGFADYSALKQKKR